MEYNYQIHSDIHVIYVLIYTLYMEGSTLTCKNRHNYTCSKATKKKKIGTAYITAVS